MISDEEFSGFEKDVNLLRKKKMKIILKSIGIFVFPIAVVLTSGFLCFRFVQMWKLIFASCGVVVLAWSILTGLYSKRYIMEYRWCNQELLISYTALAHIYKVISRVETPIINDLNALKEDIFSKIGDVEVIVNPDDPLESLTKEFVMSLPGRFVDIKRRIKDIDKEKDFPMKEFYYLKSRYTSLVVSTLNMIPIIITKMLQQKTYKSSVKRNALIKWFGTTYPEFWRAEWDDEESCEPVLENAESKSSNDKVIVTQV